MANEQNLRPQSTRSKSEQREVARKGGIASGVARREKKLMSQIYAEILADEHDIKIDGKMQKMPGDKLLKNVTMKLLLKNNATSLGVLKEIREATEGQKTKTESSISVNMEDPQTKAIIEAYGIRPHNI